MCLVLVAFGRPFETRSYGATSGIVVNLGTG